MGEPVVIMLITEVRAAKPFAEARPRVFVLPDVNARSQASR